MLFGALALIVAFYFFMFFFPIKDELAGLQSDVDQLRIKVSQEKGIADNIDSFVEEVERLEVELNKALAELPDKREIANLLASVSDLGKDSGLEIKLFKPLPEQKRDYYAEVPVELEVGGSYHQVATFFDEVGHLDRIVNLDKFSMTEPDLEKETVRLNTTVVATTFRFLDESERPTQDKKRGKKRRRGRNRG